MSLESARGGVDEAARPSSCQWKRWGGEVTEMWGGRGSRENGIVGGDRIRLQHGNSMVYFWMGGYFQGSLSLAFRGFNGD